VSTTLKNKHIRLIPWDEREGFNRGGDEPAGKRICVAPSVEQCLTAIPYYLGAVVTIYRTKTPVKASCPIGVYDAVVTQEGWITEPTMFVKLGILKFRDVEIKLGVYNVIEDAASSGDLTESRKVLNWWKKAKIQRLIKKA
jgi:hypothetical protein